MLKPRSYFLWLKPSGGAYGQLAGVIAELARQWSGPTFDPHVTLLGGLEGSEAELVERSTQLAAQLSAFPIVLRRASFGDDYFQCVFLPIESTPSLLTARGAAEHLFGRSGDDFRPHLSLLYGRHPDDRKAAIARDLPSTVCAPFDATAVHLIRADSSDPKDWYEVAACSVRQ